MLTAPTLSDDNVWNYRRMQQTSLRSELVLGPGVITGMMFLPDKVDDRVKQKGFYNSLKMLSTVEPPVATSPDRFGIEIPPLPSQVVLIAPPVILQTRSKQLDSSRRAAAGLAQLRALSQAALLAEFKKSSKRLLCWTARQRGRGIFRFSQIPTFSLVLHFGKIPKKTVKL